MFDWFRLIKLSSPKINSVIAFGCGMSLLFIPLLGIDNPEVVGRHMICSVGVTFSLGKMLQLQLTPALKMLRFSLMMTIMDKTRNTYIKGTAHVWRFGEKTRETRLRWLWHIQYMYEGNVMGMLGERCWGWNCQEGGNGEGIKWVLWMRWERTWQWFEWWRMM